MIKEKFNEFEINGIKFHYDGEYLVGVKNGFILINPLEIPFTEIMDGDVVILADDEDMRQRAFEWLEKTVKEKINENKQFN